MKNYFERGEQKSRELYEELTKKGYTVILDPTKKELPINLENYNPDLIAIKDDAGLVIEIKSSTKRISVDKLQNLSARVSKNEGWRFILVTLDNKESNIFEYTIDSLPNTKDFNERIGKIEKLINIESYEAALLYLWSSIESRLRIIAININLPIERFSAFKLMDHLYSHGELSIDEYDYLRQLIKIRNKVAHGFNFNVTSGDVSKGVNILKNLVNN